MIRQWLGAYQAVVTRNDDPLGQQRVTLRIPQVLGTAVSQWAAPVSAMGAAAPVVGTTVTVMFHGGDINHPVYLAPVTVAAGNTSIDGGTAATGQLPAGTIDGGTAATGQQPAGTIDGGSA